MVKTLPIARNLETETAKLWVSQKRTEQAARLGSDGCRVQERSEKMLNLRDGFSMIYCCLKYRSV